jgi:hypothetical protein
VSMRARALGLERGARGAAHKACGAQGGASARAWSSPAMLCAGGAFILRASEEPGCCGAAEQLRECDRSAVRDRTVGNGGRAAPRTWLLPVAVAGGVAPRAGAAAGAEAAFGGGASGLPQSAPCDAARASAAGPARNGVTQLPARRSARRRAAAALHAALHAALSASPLIGAALRMPTSAADAPSRAPRHAP